MNYIGSKLSLLSFLEEHILQIAGKDFDSLCDLFSGTAAVGSHFKKLGYRVFSNDVQYYSYVLARHYIGNSTPMAFSGVRNLVEKGLSDLFSDSYNDICAYLNSLPGIDGFIYKNYCPGGTRNQAHKRMYFTDHNGRLCDHIRSVIEEWHSASMISDDEYFYLLATLLESIDKYSNTASVYGAYLKHFKKSAARDMKLTSLPVFYSTQENEVFNEDINKLIPRISGDVLYLDPPYNQRQYAANYHILETIARYDSPEISGKTGLRDYSQEKSAWCVKRKVCDEFDYLIQNASFKYIFLSYNNEGLMSLDQIKDIMSKRGKYGLCQTKYGRFKADRDENRNHKAAHTTEYLHYLIVER